MKPRRRSKWLRGTVVFVLVAFLAVVGLYQYATRPARLRAEVERVLQSIAFTDCRIGEVSFSFWEGLEVVDLELTLNSASPLYSPDEDVRQGAPLEISYARISCDLWSLLAGRVRPTQVLLRGAVFSIVRNETTGDTNWELGPVATERPPSGAFLQSPPRITVENSAIKLLSVERGRQRLVRQWVIDADGAPENRGDPGTFVLQIRRVAGAAAPSTSSGSPGRPLAELRWTPRIQAKSTGGGAGGGAAEPDRRVEPAIPGRLEVQLDWIDVQSVSMLVPQHLVEVFEKFGMVGQARVERFVVDADHVERAAVQFVGFGLFIPVEEDGPDGQRFPPARRFLRLAQAEGRLEFDGTRLVLGAAGRVNAARGRLELEAKRRVGAAPEDPALGASAPPGATLQQILTWPYKCTLDLSGIELPEYERHQEFVESDRLPVAIRRFFSDYHPRGRCNVRVEIHDDATESGGNAFERRPLVNGIFEPLSAACRYYRFPYDVEDIRGQFLLADGAVLFRNLNGRHGSARIRVDGRVDSVDPGSGLTLSVHGEAVPLDEDLYTALPWDDRELWDRASPTGLANIAARIRRSPPNDAGDWQRVEVGIDVDIISGSLDTGDRQRLVDADGAVTIAENEVTIHDLHGFLNESAVRLNGKIKRGSESGEARLDLHVEAFDVPFEREIVVGAPVAASERGDAPDSAPAAVTQEKTRRRTSTILLRGVADVWGRMYRSASFDSHSGHYTAQIKDGELHTFEPSSIWTGVQGWVVMADGRQEIRSLSARQGAATLSLRGELPAASSKGAAAAFDVRIAHPDMQRLLPQIVPAPWQNVGDALGFSGAGRVAVRTSGPRSTEAGEAAIDVEFSAQSMRPSPAPLDLRDVQGTARIMPDGIALRTGSARYGADGRIEVSGRVGGEDGARWLDLVLKAQQVDVTSDFIAAMPGPLSEFLEGLAVRGRLDATLDRVHMTTGAVPAWSASGSLALESAQLSLGLPLTDFVGQIDGTCTVAGRERVAAEARFTIKRGTLGGRPIERFEGRLTRTPGDGRLHLTDVHGRMCGGELRGQVDIEAGTSAYELALTIMDVRLDEFLPRRGAGADADRPGRLDGRVFLRGTAGNDASRSGGGELRVRDASLLRTPVVASVVEAQNERRRPISDALEEATLDFVWEGSMLRLNHVDIRSRDLRLVGEGWWDMRDDRIELLLVGADPQQAPRIAVLSDLVDVAREELAQYRVTGTAAKPVVVIEPLHNLTEPLRKMLGAGR